MKGGSSEPRSRHHLLPAHIGAGDPEQRFRAELVLGFGAFQLLAASLFCISEMLWGTPQLGRIYAAALLLILAVLVDFRRHGKIARTANALMVVLFLNVAITNFGSGGQTLGANIALPTLVLVGVLLLSPRAAIALTVLVLLQILIVAVLRRSDIEFPITPDPEWVKSAIDRVPLFFTLAAALIGVVVQRALRRFRDRLEQSQAALLRANTLFSAVVEGTHDAILVRDCAGRFVFINRSAANLTGRLPEQLIGLSIEEVYSDAESAERVRAADRRVIENDEAFTIEYQLTLAAGVRHFSSARAPLRDSLGHVVGVIGISHDITERIQSEARLAGQAEELQRANALLTAVTEGTTDAVFVKNLEGRHVMINQAGARFLDRAPAEVIGKSDFELFAPDIAQRARDADLRVIAIGATEAGENAVTTANGRQGLFSTVRAPWRDAGGHILGVIGVARDITLQRESELTIGRHAERMKDMFEHSLGLICTHDLNGVLLSINPAAARTLGYSAEELVGCNLADLTAEAARPFFPGYLKRIASEQLDSGQFYLTARSGEQRIWEYHNRLYRGSDSAPYVMGNAADVTERRLFEHHLREQSIRDPLTGCYNRRYLDKIAAGFAPEQSWGCVVVDLDHFKQINDTHGHQRGDAVLVAMGQFLNNHARQGDAVIRMGGDEFMLWLPNADAAAIEATAARIRAAAEADAPCGISIGHALREGAESLEKTIDRADKHLYRVRVAVRGVERRADRAE